MPTYEYECEKCGKNFDIFQSMKDSAFETCPEAACRMETWGNGKVRRQLGTGAGIIFKGSGFYTTDYRSEGYKQSAKKEGSSGESTGGAATTEPAKTESKPAADKPAPKSETKPAA